MPRTIIAPIAASGGYPSAGVVAASTAADVGNGNRCLHTGQNFLIHARNSGSTTRAITITSVADATQNRTGDISDTLTNAQTKIFGPFAVDGFKQTDGYLWFSGAHAEVLFTVIRF
jgi:hypothetical protein